MMENEHKISNLPEDAGAKAAAEPARRAMALTDFMTRRVLRCCARATNAIREDAGRRAGTVGR